MSAYEDALNAGGVPISETPYEAALKQGGVPLEEPGIFTRAGRALTSIPFSGIEGAPSGEESPAPFREAIAAAARSSVGKPFVKQYDTIRGSFLKGGAALTRGVTDIGEYVGKPMGIPRSEVFDKAAQMWQDKGEELHQLAQEKGADFVDKMVGSAIGGGVPGVAEFMLNVPYYSFKGAIEAAKRGDNQAWGAIVGGAKRAALGKTLHAAGTLTKPLAIPAMGTVMGVQTAAEGGTPEETAEAVGTGMIFGAVGAPGRTGAREVGRTIYEGIDRLIRSKKPITIETPSPGATRPPIEPPRSTVAPEVTPTPPPAPEATISPEMAPGSPEFYKAEADRLGVRFAGITETGLPSRPKMVVFQDGDNKTGAGSFTLNPGESVEQALERARSRYAEKPAEPVSPMPAPATDVIPAEQRAKERPRRSAFREDQVPDLPTADKDIAVVRSNIVDLEAEIERRAETGSTLDRMEIQDRLNKHNESLAALEARRAEILEGKSLAPIEMKPPEPIRTKTPEEISFEEARAAREPLPRTGEVEPPVQTPGQKFAQVRKEKIKAKKEAAGPTLQQRILRAGGIKIDPAMRGEFAQYGLRQGEGALARLYRSEKHPGYKKAMGWDQWVETLIEDGTLPKGAGISDLFEAIKKNKRPGAEIADEEFARSAAESAARTARETVPENEIALGDSFRIDGEKFKAVRYDERGNLIVKDGREITVEANTGLRVDGGKEEIIPGEIPRPPKEAEAPKGEPFKLATEEAPEAEKPLIPEAAGEQDELFPGERAKYREAEKGPPAPPPEGGLFGESGESKAIADVARGVIQSADDVNKVFAPYARGEQAQAAAGIVREKVAAEALSREKAYNKFKAFDEAFQKVPEPKRLEYIDAIEGGKSTGNVTADQAFAVMRSIREPLWKKIQEMKGTEAFIENYFPHFWEQPDVAARVLGRQPLAGPASFLKERKIPTTKEGIELGLKPKTTNPVELETLKINEMLRFIKGQEIFGEFKDTGLAKFVRFGDKAPKGYVKINDKIARILQYSEAEKGFVLRGDYYAPEPAARVLNNYLSPGLWGRSTLYGIFRGAGNFMNQVQLGMSAFHFTFTSVDAVTSRFALGVQELGRGQFSEGIKHVSPHNLVTAPIEMFLKGNKAMKGIFAENPEFAKITDALIKGGGRVKMDLFYKNSSVERFWKALGEKKFGRVGVQAIPAAIEALAKPVMEKWVPRMKLGIFSEMAESQMALWKKQGHEPSVSEMRTEYGKIWDSIDNRMGQMVYDNLFWNRTLKDVGLASVRSLGWNLGTLRELGGGVKDIIDIKVNNSGGVKISPRTAYLLALPAVVALYGAMYQYIKTGEGPEEFKDYFFPKTGGKTPDGRDERVTIPSYIKDIYAYWKHPLTTVGHKVHPIISSIVQMLQNQDYYSVMIRNPNDPKVKQATDFMRYVGTQFIPFSVRGAQIRQKSGTDTKEQAESFFGVVPAPKGITQTKAEELLDEFSKRHMGKGPITREEQLKKQAKAEIRDQFKKKQVGELRVAIEKSGLQPAEIKNVLQNSRKPALVMRFLSLSPEEAMQVWRVADGIEMESLFPILLRKIVISKNISPKEKINYINEIKKTRKAK
jgi:hypothetical protein